MESGRDLRRRNVPRQLRLADFSYLRPRLALVYAKQCTSVLRRLCPNVVREVCSYLWFRPKLLISRSDRLWSFDLTESRWKAEHGPFLLLRDMVIDTVVHFGVDEAFLQVVGLRGNTCFILRNGELDKIPPLNRTSFGAVFDPPRLRICLFGGTAARLCSRQCDQWLLRTGEWRPLPDMQVVKFLFCPCWFLGKVYLCDRVIEVFDPLTDSFSLVNLRLEALYLSSFFYIAVPHQDEIAIILEKAIVSWRPDTNTMRKICSISLCFAPRICPVASEQSVYLLYDDFQGWKCMTMDISDGQSKKVHSATLVAASQ